MPALETCGCVQWPMCCTCTFHVNATGPLTGAVCCYMPGPWKPACASASCLSCQPGACPCGCGCDLRLVEFGGSLAKAPMQNLVCKGPALGSIHCSGCEHAGIRKHMPSTSGRGGYPHTTAPLYNIELCDHEQRVFCMLACSGCTGPMVTDQPVRKHGGMPAAAPPAAPGS